MVDKLTDEFGKLYQKGSQLKNSIDSDCGVILKMYTSSGEAITDPEENLSSPLSELDLISRGNERGNYIKTKPSYNKLDRLAVLFVIVANLADGKRSVDIDTLLTQDNNIGKIFYLDRNMINDYLDRIRQDGLIQINRTAGLDMIYVSDDLTPVKILKLYYSQSETEV